MSTIKLEHLNLKALSKAERVGAVKHAVLTSLGNLEHGVHRRVELDIDDLWTILDQPRSTDKPKLVGIEKASEVEIEPTVQRAIEVLKDDMDVKEGDYIENADLYHLPIGTEFRVENGGWDGRIVSKDDEKYMHIIKTEKLFKLIPVEKHELDITITKRGN